MKNFIQKLAIGAIIYPLLARAAYADTFDPCGNGAAGVTKILCGFTAGKANTIIGNIITFIIILAVVIALVYLLYGGIKWITSKGDKTEVESARNHITAAIVGLIVVFLAIFIVSIVLTLFGLQFGNLAIPSLLNGTGGNGI